MERSDIEYVDFEDLGREIIYENPTEKEIDFPVVYTTRLDDMHILTKDDLKLLTIRDIYERIIKESKPTLIHRPKRHSIIYKREDSYTNVVKKIQHINTMLRKDIFSKLNKSEKTKKTGISQSDRRAVENVVYISSEEDSDDQSHIRSIFLSIHNDPCDSDETFCDEPFNEPATDEPMSVPNMNYVTNVRISHDTISDCANYKIHNSYLILTYMYSDYKDIYYIDDQNTPTEYYRMKSTIEHNNIIDYTKIQCVMEINNCCWYKREKRLQQLWSNITNKSGLKLISEKHPCIPNKCGCCCKIKTGKNTRTNTLPVIPSKRIEELDINNSIILRQHYDRSKWNYQLLKDRDLGIVTRALLFEHNMPKRGLRIKRKKNYRRCTLMQITHLGVSSSTEFFFLNDDGLIQTSLFLPIIPNSSDILALNQMIERGRYFFPSTVCCWYKYDQSICELSNYVLTSVVNFMKKQHACSAAFCNCCCKYSHNSNIKVTQPPFIQLERNNKHTNGFTLKIKSFTKSQRRGKKKQGTTPIIISVIGNTPSTSTSDELTKTKTDLPSSLSSEIEEVLKDLQLIIRDKGDVAAIINKSVVQLSTRKLMILSLIIRSAQKRVNQLGVAKMNSAAINIIIKDFVTTKQNVINKHNANTKEVQLSNKGVRNEKLSSDYIKSTSTTINTISNQNFKYNRYTNIMNKKVKEYCQSLIALKNKCKSMQSLKYVENLKSKVHYNEMDWHKIYQSKTETTVMEPTAVKRKPINEELLLSVNTCAKKVKLLEYQKIQDQQPTTNNVNSQENLLQNNETVILPPTPCVSSYKLMPMQIQYPPKNDKQINANAIRTCVSEIPSTSSKGQQAQNVTLLLYPQNALAANKDNTLLKNMLLRPAVTPRTVLNSDTTLGSVCEKSTATNSTDTDDNECVLGI